MQLSLIPAAALIILNLTIIFYVVRQQDRPRSGFFLIVNAVCLLVWASGQALFQFIGDESPWVLTLPYLAGLLIPANFLYYALTRPHPLREYGRGPVLMIVLFAPAFILTLLEDYSDPRVQLLFSYSYTTESLTLANLTRRITFIYLALLVFGSVAIQSVRYYTSTGPEQNASKHLVATIVGPIFFASLFWVSSAEGAPTIIPSPSFILVIMAQVGLLVVLRQEEIRNPKTLNRLVYYLIAILVAFILVNLLFQFYIYVQGRIVLERTAAWFILSATLLLLLIARVRFVEKAFDKLIFQRAHEYRKVVDETRHELREARERLRHAERLSMVGEVSARVAHEIKNPLGPIKGYTQMMREKMEANPDFPEQENFLRYIDVIQEEIDNIDRRIKEFLKSTREPSLYLEEANLNDIVRRCVSVLRLELTAGRDMGDTLLPIVIEGEIEESLPVVKIDIARFEEALFNLARNSLEALGENTSGRIRLKTCHARNDEGEEGVEISVLDNGPGFSDEDLQKSSNSFYTQKKGGTGLGLAIVRSTVEAHGGSIKIGNRPFGGGHVRMWLPYETRENPGALLPKPV